MQTWPTPKTHVRYKYLPTACRRDSRLTIGATRSAECRSAYAGSQPARKSLGILRGIVSLVFTLVISGQYCQSMDRWAALSQLESGDNDSARGAAGEVSRYQVRPEIWEHYAAANMNWLVPADALRVAQSIMRARCAEFEHTSGRRPTDFEFYVLWNAPARIEQPAKAVQERARRFCNLVSKPEP
jgi:hypothetical protein